MKDIIDLSGSPPLKGEITPPPDKSISHRALIFASIAMGQSTISNVLRADDPMRTLKALRYLGVDITDRGEALEVHGRGLRGLRKPEDVIDCGNSGTTMRLLAGLLAGQPFFSVLTGDESLRRRPMKRVMDPLRMMGATLSGGAEDKLPPISVRGGSLKPIHYRSPVASAQVKSAVLIAGLYTEGTTTVEEPLRSRDHTERMLPSLGAKIKIDGLRVSVEGGNELTPLDMAVPGDFSSAAFFIATAALVKGSEIIIRNVNINPTRTGLLKVMKRMGASVEILEQREASGEPAADLLCRHTKNLTATQIGAEEVPSMIDELPVFCVLASRAEGVTTISGAAELRVKESDRIASMASGLRSMGVKISELPDGMRIHGPADLRGAALQCRLDHRVAMALSVAALAAEGRSSIKGIASVGTSFPEFYKYLERLSET